MSANITDEIQKEINRTLGRMAFMAKQVTTDMFWDCSCAVEYIHPVNVTECPVCHDKRNDCPDSRITEVLKHKDTLHLTKAVADKLSRLL